MLSRIFDGKVADKPNDILSTSYYLITQIIKPAHFDNAIIQILPLIVLFTIKSMELHVFTHFNISCIAVYFSN